MDVVNLFVLGVILMSGCLLIIVGIGEEIIGFFDVMYLYSFKG